MVQHSIVRIHAIEERQRSSKDQGEEASVRTTYGRRLQGQTILLQHRPARFPPLLTFALALAFAVLAALFSDGYIARPEDR